MQRSGAEPEGVESSLPLIFSKPEAEISFEKFRSQSDLNQKPWSQSRWDQNFSLWIIEFFFLFERDFESIYHYEMIMMFLEVKEFALHLCVHSNLEFHKLY